MDEELSSLEAKIHKELLSLQSPSAGASIRKNLESLLETLQSLSQLLITEDQRRHTNKPELRSCLPTGVHHLLSLVDLQETEKNRASVSSHARFVEVCENLLMRVVSEIERYHEKVEELKVIFIHLMIYWPDCVY